MDFDPMNLRPVSYKVTYLQTPRNGPAVQNTMYFEVQGGLAKMKWETLISADPKNPMKQEMIVLATLGPTGEFGKVEKAVMYAPMGPMGTMRVDATQMMSMDKSPGMYSTANNKELLKQAQKLEYLGDRNIVGVTGKMYRMTAEKYSMVFCYHPEYAIVLYMESKDFKMEATDLRIGDIPDEEFNTEKEAKMSLNLGNIFGGLK